MVRRASSALSNFIYMILPQKMLGVLKELFHVEFHPSIFNTFIKLVQVRPENGLILENGLLLEIIQVVSFHATWYYEGSLVA